MYGHMRVVVWLFVARKRIKFDLERAYRQSFAIDSSYSLSPSLHTYIGNMHFSMRSLETTPGDT